MPMLQSTCECLSVMPDAVDSHTIWAYAPHNMGKLFGEKLKFQRHGKSNISVSNNCVAGYMPFILDISLILHELITKNKCCTATKAVRNILGGVNNSLTKGASELCKRRKIQTAVLVLLRLVIIDVDTALKRSNCCSQLRLHS